MKTVIEMMAREAEGDHVQPGLWAMRTEDLERFAELVRSDEREVISEKNKTVIEQINKQMQELREAVLAENEACALIADEAEPYNAADLIRKRVKK